MKAAQVIALETYLFVLTQKSVLLYVASKQELNIYFFGGVNKYVKYHLLDFMALDFCIHCAGESIWHEKCAWTHTGSGSQTHSWLDFA